jgi:hypothetical protein
VPFAFEIEKVYIPPRVIARLLTGIDGVTDVRKRKPFSASSESHVEFRYFNDPYVVWEPWGDSSRYWIGPEHPEAVRPDIREIENAFRRHRPPVHRQWLGDILSLKFITRFFRR